MKTIFYGISLTMSSACYFYGMFLQYFSNIKIYLNDARQGVVSWNIYYPAVTENDHKYFFGTKYIVLLKK